MPNERLVAETALCKLWRVGSVTLRNWRRKGLLVPDLTERAVGVVKGKPSHFYTISTLEALHNAWATGFSRDAPQPSLEKLLHSEHSLLTPDEVARMFGRSISTIQQRVHDGKLPAFRIGPKHIRLPTITITILLHSEDGLVTPELAAKVLCIKELKKFRQKDRLKRASSQKRHRRQQLITRKSLLTLLTELIPPFITPEEWWEKTIQPQGKPVTLSEFAKNHGINWHTLDRYIKAGHPSLAYIRFVGARAYTLVPAWAVQKFLKEEREQLAPATIGAFFGVDDATVRQWIAGRKFCKRRHGAAARYCPSHNCVLHYIEANKTSSSFAALNWAAWVQQDQAIPITSAALLAELPGMDHDDIVEQLEHGVLAGVWLPSKKGKPLASIRRTDAAGLKRMRERQLYKDYHFHLDEV